MTHYSRLQCIACDATYPTDRLHFRCDCGDLLAVQHDLEAVQAVGRPGEEWPRGDEGM